MTVRVVAVKIQRSRFGMCPKMWSGGNWLRSTTCECSEFIRFIRFLALQRVGAVISNRCVLVFRYEFLHFVLLLHLFDFYHQLVGEEGGVGRTLAQNVYRRVDGM